MFKSILLYLNWSINIKKMKKIILLVAVITIYSCSGGDDNNSNSINKLIDPNFKPSPGNLIRNSKSKRRGKGANNKKRK